MILRLSVLFLVALTASSILASTVTSSSYQESSDPAALEVQVVKLYREGKFDEAIPLAKQVLRIREGQLAASDPLLADSMGNLAMLYMAKGKFDDADSLLKRALAIYEQSPDKNALVLSKTLDSLGNVRLFKSDKKAAEEFFLRALAIKEKNLKPDHEEIFSSLNSLVDLYTVNKDYAKASAMMARIIAIKEQKLGDSDTQVGRLIERRACLMYRGHDDAEAEKVEARANHILYSVLATRPEPIELPSQVFACKIITNPRPDFPSVARSRGFSGKVTMDVAVETDEAGNVTSVKFVGGDKAFKSVAENAAWGAKIRPTIVDGRPVKVSGVISYGFMSTTRTIIVAVPGRVVSRP